MAGRDTERGTQRFRGPAAAKRIIWPNAPASQRLNPETHESTTCIEGEECSCSRTLVLGPTTSDHMKVRQRHLFGTTKWRADYGRRNNVESGNSILKHHHVKVSRGSVRVFGSIKTMILLAFVFGAANVRLVMSRYRLDPGDELPGDQIEPQPTKARKEPSLHSHVFKGRRARRARFASKANKQAEGQALPHSSGIDWQPPPRPTTPADQE